MDGFCALLERWGHSPTGAAELVRLMAHLSRWLDEQRLAAGDLNGEVIKRFLVDRRQQYRRRRSGQALGPLLVYLRSVGVVPEPIRQPTVARWRCWWTGTGGIWCRSEAGGCLGAPLPADDRKVPRPAAGSDRGGTRAAGSASSRITAESMVASATWWPSSGP